MKRKLGRSGIEVSAMGMGCFAIGGTFWRPASSLSWTEGSEAEFVPAGWGEIDDTESIKALHAAMDAGVDFFDTSESYGCGHSEAIMGKAFAGKRDKVVIATKFGNLIDEDKRRYLGKPDDLTPDYIRNSCEASLRRLNTDYIDLYQIHWSDFDGDIDPVIEGLEALVKEGKIRSYGWSTDDVDRMQGLAKGEHCAAVQHMFSLIRDAPEMLALCDEFDLASINRSPLAMGLLTGKFDAISTFPENDIRHGWNLGEGRLADILKMVDALRDVLTMDGRTLVQGAIGWIWAKHERTIPIPGFKTVKQVEENASAMEFGPLNPNQMQQIDEILERLNSREKTK